MPITLRDIAKEVGVSHTTISLVLNDRAHKSIPQITRDRVLEAANRLGYRPNHMARALVTGRSNAVAIWTYAPHRPYYALIIKSLQAEADKRGYRTLISQTSTSLFDDDTTSPEADDWPVDGIIAMDGTNRIESFKQAVGEAAMPIVSIGNVVSRESDYVILDVSSGVVDAIRHLWSTGRRKIVYITLSVLNTEYFLGTKGYEQGMREVGGQDARLLLHHHGKATAREAVCEYIAEHGAPDAFVCRSDEFAIGTYRALRDLNLRIPEDVAIVGCGGIDDLRYFDPEISTIKMPVDEMCNLAWTYLENRLADSTLPIQGAELSGVLQLRGSSASKQMATAGFSAR